jgi:hypothetical protein
LKVHGVKDVSQTYIQTAEILVPEPSTFEAEIAIGKLQRCKSPDTGQIPQELIQAGRHTLRSETHKLINSIWNKEDLPQQ